MCAAGHWYLGKFALRENVRKGFVRGENCTLRGVYLGWIVDELLEVEGFSRIKRLRSMHTSLYVGGIFMFVQTHILWFGSNCYIAGFRGSGLHQMHWIWSSWRIFKNVGREKTHTSLCLGGSSICGKLSMLQMYWISIQFECQMSSRPYEDMKIYDEQNSHPNGWKNKSRHHFLIIFEVDLCENMPYVLMFWDLEFSENQPGEIRFPWKLNFGLSSIWISGAGDQTQPLSDADQAVFFSDT